ncbi:methyltransferase-like protein 25B [Sabethes cyaneus]|uniref:methyltransferase-like protein 25B n=1 Tax=Sabethes cyaneus TaxID=53552 RepID=UPI00237EAD54|nr:methyltransferase-like protein 25B [Sabethes cyaneus]
MPVNFNEKFDFVAYFEQCTKFLTEYKWIFESSNTKFVQAGILEEFPKPWIGDLDSTANEQFNRIPLGYVNQDWSSSFQTFLNRLKGLIINYDRLEACSVKGPNLKGVSPKKMYEIENLTSVIGGICNNGEVLLDFGSGLGYLSQNLHSKHGFTVLGIDGDAYRVTESQNRQARLFPQSASHVKFLNHIIEASSFQHLKYLAAAMFNRVTEPNLAIVGLHACADLSIDAIKMFLDNDAVNKLVIMPCCYHKLKPTDEACTTFEQFPVSSQLREILNNSSNSFLGRPFLRLGCQQTSARWETMNEEEHELHGKSMFERSLVEAVLTTDEFVKIKKSSGRDESNLLEKYLLFHKSDPQTNMAWTSEHIERYEKLFVKYPTGGRLAEYLTCLQTCLQSVCENLILLDRICYIQTEANQRDINLNVKLVKFANESLSPRCSVILAHKNACR